MEKYNIRFKDIEQVCKFVALADRCNSNMDLGEGAVIIDAKSIQGIIAIGMNKTMSLTVHGTISNELKKFIENM